MRLECLREKGHLILKDYSGVRNVCLILVKLMQDIFSPNVAKKEVKMETSRVSRFALYCPDVCVVRDPPEQLALFSDVSRYKTNL